MTGLKITILLKRKRKILMRNSLRLFIEKVYVPVLVVAMIAVGSIVSLFMYGDD
jgi:hypothetical protein